MIEFRKWMKPPEFQGEENKTQRARVLYVTLLSFLGYLSIFQLAILFGGRIPTANNWVEISLLMVCIGSYFGLQKGFVKPVSIVLIALTYILVTISIVNIGTVRAPITSVYHALIIVGGLLFDLAGVLITITLSSVVIGGLILAQRAGLLAQPDLSVTIVQWITFVAIFITNGGLVVVVLRWTRRALHRAEIEIIERKRAEWELHENQQELERTNSALQTALTEVKTLSGLLPICASCKKIRDDKGYWNQIETYISKHTDARFTHGICPDCKMLLISSSNMPE